MFYLQFTLRKKILGIIELFLKIKIYVGVVCVYII